MIDPVAPTPVPEDNTGPNVDSLGATPVVPSRQMPPSGAALPSTPAPTALPKAPPVQYSAEKIAALRRRLLRLAIAGYSLYILWSVALIVILPDPAGGLKTLVSVGLLVALIGLILFATIGWLGLRRIAAAKISIARRQSILIKLGIFLAPGILLSAIVPLMILREPALPLDIISPTRAEDFVAPLAVTFSAERAADILQKQGLRPIKYQWDTDGDGTMNDETVLPTVTSLYERQGSYAPVVRIVLSDQSIRRVVRQLSIPISVFSVKPVEPIVERPALFDLSHLLADRETAITVQWDFGDGTEPVDATVPEMMHTYYAVGSYPVTALLTLENQSQLTLTRTVNVINPPPLPFPVTLSAEPERLLGPAPFGVMFSINTQEPVREIEWNFGDGTTERGADLFRVGHSFERQGVFAASVRVRNASGAAADLTTIVRATDTLALSDLRFAGQPELNGNTIAGEAPLRIDLTPKTSVPLVSFYWEVPASDGLTVSDERVQGTYRKEGTYTITLIAEDAEGKSMRMPITVDVGSPSAAPTIVAKPENGVAPLKVVFDASQTFIPPGKTLAGFQWSFGDEDRQSRNAEPGPARVEHTFDDAGEYIVTLRVILTSGEEYQSQRTIVVRRPTLSACITASRLTVEAGKAIEFDSGCSAGAVQSYLWDVRSDVQPDVALAQSPLPTYVHVFEQPGTYIINLTIKDQWNNEDTKQMMITVTQRGGGPVVPGPASSNTASSAPAPSSGASSF